VIAEYNGSTGALINEYIYAGSRMIAREQAGVIRYFHQDRLSTRLITDASGNVVGTMDHLPFGEDAGVVGESEKHRFTTYERDGESGTDYAINRQYSQSAGRFMRPDPVGGRLIEPQSFNRYEYTLNDPINLIDPLGLYEPCIHEAMTRYLARLAGLPKTTAHQLGRYAGDKPGGADSPEFAVNWPSFLEPAWKWAIHFPTEEQLVSFKSSFWSDLDSGTQAGMQKAGHTLHSIEDAHGAHRGYIGNPFGHLTVGHSVDRIIGDQKFLDASNEILQLLKKDPNAKLTTQQINDLLDSILEGCKNKNFELRVIRPTAMGEISGGGFYGFYGRGFFGVPWWYYSMLEFLSWVDSIGEGKVTSTYKLYPPEEN
jgi:RHS repeat-associated protein